MVFKLFQDIVLMFGPNSQEILLISSKVMSFATIWMDNGEILRKLPAFPTIWVDSGEISEKASLC